MHSILNKGIFAGFVSIIIFLVGCTEETVIENESELIVVTAYLFEGQPIEDIQLTKTLVLGSEDTIAPPVSNALVKLIKDGNNYLLESNIDREGYYSYSGTDLSINTNDHFFIEISFGDQIITGETDVPFKPTNVTISKEEIIFKEISFGGGLGGGFANDTNSILIDWDNIDSTLYYVVIENLEDDPESMFSDLPFARFKRFISAPAATSEYSINRSTVTHYGSHQAIVYKVNQEYADLYGTREQDSRNLNEPLSNITNGLGVFSAFASDTVYFEVKK